MYLMHNDTQEGIREFIDHLALAAKGADPVLFFAYMGMQPLVGSLMHQVVNDPWLVDKLGVGVYWNHSKTHIRSSSGLLLSEPADLFRPRFLSQYIFRPMLRESEVSLGYTVTETFLFRLANVLINVGRGILTDASKMGVGPMVTYAEVHRSQVDQWAQQLFCVNKSIVIDANAQVI